MRDIVEPARSQDQISSVPQSRLLGRNPHSERKLSARPGRMEMWKSPKNGDFTHFHRTTTTTLYTDISNGH
jgi:hypothetical protein